MKIDHCAPGESGGEPPSPEESLGERVEPRGKPIKPGKAGKRNGRERGQMKKSRIDLLEMAFADGDVAKTQWVLVRRTHGRRELPVEVDQRIVTERFDE